MFDKLDFILEKYEELSMKVSDPDVITINRFGRSTLRKWAKWNQS